MKGEKTIWEGGEAEIVCFRLRLKVSMAGDERISSGGVEFNMTGATERKDRDLKLVLNGVGWGGVGWGGVGWGGSELFARNIYFVSYL